MLKINQLFGFALVGFFRSLQPVCKCRHDRSRMSASAGSRKPAQTDLFEASLKDLTCTVKTAGEDASVPTVSAARDVFQKAMNQKLGDLDMTAVVRLF